MATPPIPPTTPPVAPAASTPSTPNQVPNTLLPVNSLQQDDSFGLSDLGRIRDQYHTEPAAIRAMRLRGEQAAKNIWDLDKKDKDFDKNLLKNTRVLTSTHSRLDVYKNAKEDRLNEQAANIVSRNLAPSAVNSYVAQNSNSLEAQVAGAALTGQGYGALGAQRKQILGQMKGIRQDSVSAASIYVDEKGVNPNSQSVLQSGSTQMQDLAKQLIPITLAMQQLKQQGMDPKGRQEELSRIGNKAAGVLHTNQLQDEMKSGTGMGALSMGELKKKEVDAAEKLTKALLALTNSVGKTADELNELNKEAEEAAEEFKKVSEAKGEKGKDEKSNKFENIKLIAGTVMEALDISTQLYENVAINQPMQMVNNTTASANLENDKYNQWHAALAGNMHERMNLDWTDAQKFGDTLADNKNTAHNMRQTSAGIGMLVGAGQIGVGIAGAAGGTVVGVNPVEQIAGGVKTFASATANEISELAAQQRQTEMTPLRIAGARNFQEAKRALSKISGQQAQGYRDYAMGINQTAGAMGGEAGEAFLNETGGADFIQKLSDAGIGTQEFNQLSLRGQKQMGERFNKEQIFEATKLERMGYGDADENMQRIGTLAAAGKGDAAADLGKIIEDAMQRGLNSSKALDMIAENTAKLNENALMKGSGIDATQSISNAILKGFQQDTGNDTMALKIAQQGYEQGEAARTNVATSLPGFLNVDRNMNDFGVDRQSAILLTKMSSAEVDGLRKIEGEIDKAEADGDDKKTEEKKREREHFFMSKGINTAGMTDKTGMADKLDINAAVATVARQSGLGYVVADPGAYVAELVKNKNKPEIIEAMVYGGEGLKNLTPWQQELYRQRAATDRLEDANPIATNARAAVEAGVLDKTKTDKKLAQLKIDSKQNLVDEARLPKKAESGKTAEGAKAFGDSAAKAISALAESGRQAFEKMGNKGVGAEAAWKTAAETTAANFGKSTTLIGNAATAMETAVKKMANSSNLMAASGATFSKAVSAAIAKIADKLSVLDRKDAQLTDEQKAFRATLKRRYGG